MTSTPLPVACATALPALLGAHLCVQSAPFVPEFRLYLADQVVPLWQATESLAGERQAPPFWAFAWPGSLALARYLLDTPALVKGKRVLDFGSGGGLAAIAAMRCGAAHVLAADIDPLAATVQCLNAELNSVTFERTSQDLVAGITFEPTLQDLVAGVTFERTSQELVAGDVAPPVDVEVVLAGDVCYERDPAVHVIAWLRRQAERGATVLLADPGRAYAPADGLDLLAAYDVPTLPDLESAAEKRTHLWRVRAR